jgi:hypothetical protein
MDVVTGWTGRAACALQAALRMSNEAFAAHLDIGVRTVAGWHQKPGLRPRPETQQLLDTALARAPAAAGGRFAVLTGQPPPAAGVRTDENGAAADAEHRLITDQDISGALGRLDQLAAGNLERLAGTSRHGWPGWTGGTWPTGRAGEGASAGVASRMRWASTTVTRPASTAVTAHAAGMMTLRS